MTVTLIVTGIFAFTLGTLLGLMICARHLELECDTAAWEG